MTPNLTYYTLISQYGVRSYWRLNHVRGARTQLKRDDHWSKRPPGIYTILKTVVWSDGSITTDVMED